MSSSWGASLQLLRTAFALPCILTFRSLLAPTAPSQPCVVRPSDVDAYGSDWSLTPVSTDFIILNLGMALKDLVAASEGYCRRPSLAMAPPSPVFNLCLGQSIDCV